MKEILWQVGKMREKDAIEELLVWKEKFLQELSIRKMSKNTILLCDRESERFIEFCRESELQRIEDIDSNFMRLYFFDVKEKFQNKNCREISTNSMNIAISRIRVFFDFISENHDNFLDLTKCFKKIKTVNVQKEIKRFSQKENEKILSSINALKKILIGQKPRTLQNLRMLFAISILYYGGLRSAEVLNLRKKDFFEQENENQLFFVLKIMGKGNKYREVPILHSYLSDFERLLKPLQEDERVFPFTYRALRKGVEKFEINAGISKLGNHSFRHNLATNLVGKNVNMQVISEILGHSNILTTTRFYSRVSLGHKMKALTLK